VFLIGSRGQTLAHERNLKPAWSAAMPTHLDALPTLANQLAEALYARIAAGELAAVDLVYARAEAGTDLAIERHSLLPLDYELFMRATHTYPPLTTLPPEILLARLSEEYVFAQLYKAAMHAYEAENEARMRAMAAAKTSIETRLQGLTQRERQLRQDEITEEIIELAAGAEAISAARRRSATRSNPSEGQP
jgi:F-type H+-transporting ATPase subunit gamma